MNINTRTPVAALVCALLLTAALLPPRAEAGKAALVREAARKMFSQVSRSGGRRGARELTRRFGREGVEDVLQRALREGGEAAVERVVRIGGQYGARGIRAVAPSPSVMSRALTALPPDTARRAVNSVNRQPRLMHELVNRHGSRALTLELAHPGVGGRLLHQFGDDVLRLGRQLDTNQMIRFSKQAERVRTLPPGQRGSLVDMLSKTPGRVLDALETHPNVLRACTALGIGGMVVGGTVQTGKYALSGSTETVHSDGTITRVAGPLAIHGQDLAARCGTGMQWSLILLAAGAVFVGILRYGGAALRRHGAPRPGNTTNSTPSATARGTQNPAPGKEEA